MHIITKTTLLTSLTCALSATASDSIDDLLNMSLTSLADTKVTSATRTSQSLADTPAAVYVITAKEINRSGARSVADALALAPGLHVAKFSNYDWGITARGSNKALSNNLLVMVDGRSVFNPMFSGVDWDLIPVSIDNIEQIEIILGPVGTTWGGNAVNGVINIITLEAENALEAQLTVKTGNWGYTEYQMRHAAQVSDYAYVSGYFEFVEHPPWTSDQEIVQAIDHFTVYTERFGGRYDYQNLAHTLNVQAGGIRSREDYLWANYLPDAYFPNTPGFIEYDTEMTMEEYFIGAHHVYDIYNDNTLESDVWLTYSSNDGTDRDAAYFRFDLDSRWNNNDLWNTKFTIGGNIRLIDEELATYSEYDILTMPYLRINDDSRFLNESYGIYANWNIPLSDSTNLTLGHRWQYNNISDEIDAQPQIRLSQQLTDNQNLWFGWGKAVVTPSRLERDTNLRTNTVYDCNVPLQYQSPWCGVGTGQQDDVYIVTGQLGNDKLKTETVETYELGYRFWHDDKLHISLSSYYSIHENVRNYLYTGIYGDWESYPETLFVMQGSFITDDIWTETYGGEISAKWQPLEQLQINTNYSYKRIIGHCNTNLCSNDDKRKIENEPNHFVNAQIMWDINKQWWANATLQYVGKSELHRDYQPNDGYDHTWPEVVNLDLALSWKYNKYAPRITATVEGIGADQETEFAEIKGSFQNGTQYWVTVEWAVAQDI
ncbi:TonB-dependent receptor plug domain-containing protein [Vibrio renipiscarius]|uniref:TonB-dependent receptor n=1 Tax=Vibrio renipiscarius TaxID=1461322 RepID=A0A0C2NNX0_9VIBR|nr:TonB-dependent receptor [Vibrio renipiscarius]KII76508.1 TonB-dependent receptor [Vibrio renipiscarius]KII77970.1 TonB-dependent receptor [Vibrio renipiscarius]